MTTDVVYVEQHGYTSRCRNFQNLLSNDVLDTTSFENDYLSPPQHKR
jgi:hypothetical protein